MSSNGFRAFLSLYFSKESWIIWIIYLDLKLSRNNDGTLNFSIFCKPTRTEKYLDFNSNHPLEHKNSVVQSLMHRAFNLCDEELRQQEIDHVSNVLENNGYPKGMIKKFEQRTRRNFSRSNSNNQVGQEPEVEKKSYISIPYFPETSEILKRLQEI